MESANRIISGGGWLAREAVGKPRAHSFRALSLNWLYVTFVASCPFWNGWPPLGFLEWTCAILLMLQLIFVLLAAAFFVIEPPKSFTVQLRNPSYDPRNLY